MSKRKTGTPAWEKDWIDYTFREKCECALGGVVLVGSIALMMWAEYDKGGAAGERPSPSGR